jgi:heat-inducible transcriptional repressor
MRQAATVLARTSNSASLVTQPVVETSRFKHLELISIQGRLALMVLVLHGGAVHQRMLTLADSVSQSVLSESADHINLICNNLNANQIRTRSRQFNELEREIIEIAADLIDRSASSLTRTVYREGLSEIINAFPDSEGAQQAVRLFEERAFLDVILNDILQPFFEDERDIQVIIAGNGREELNQLSLVLSRYGVPGKMNGTLGIIGPMNLNYGRAISAVRKVSGLMTGMLVDLYDEYDQGRDRPSSDQPPTLEND